MFAVQGRRADVAPWGAAEIHRGTRLPHGPGFGVVNLRQAAALAQVFIPHHLSGIQHRRGRHTGAAQRLLQLVFVAAANTGADGRVHRCLVRLARGVVRPLGGVQTQHPAAHLPLRLGFGGEGDPLVFPAGLVDAMRRVQWMSVAERPAHPAGGLELQPRIADEGEVRLLHGKVDELPGAGAVPVQERRGNGCETTESGHRVRIHLPGVQRGAAFVTQQRGHPAGWLDGAADARHVRPRPAGAVSGQARHHQIWLDGLERVVAEAQVAHHAGREVVRHEVHVRHQRLEGLNAGGVRQIQRDAPFVEIDRVVHRVAIPGVACGRHVPQALRYRVLIGAAPTVEPLAGLHLDDVRAMQREQHRRVGAGPRLGEDEAAKAAQRAALGRWPALRMGRGEVRPRGLEARHVRALLAQFPMQAPLARTQPHGRAGETRALGRTDEEATRLELRILGHLVQAEHGPGHHTLPREGVEQVAASPSRHAFPHRHRITIPELAAQAGLLQLRVVRELGQTEQVHGLLPEHRPRQGQREVAVLDRHRACVHVDVRIVPLPHEAGVLRPQQGWPEARRQRFPLRDVDELAFIAGRALLRQGANHRPERQSAGLVRRLVTAALERRLAEDAVDGSPA